MTARVQRFTVSTLLVLAFALSVFAWLGIYRLAYADGETIHAIQDITPDRALRLEGSPVADPVENPGDSVSVAFTLWRNGQIPQALIVVGFVVATFASRKIPWLSQGSRALYVTSFLAALGMLAEAASRGTTPNASMMLSAFMMAVGLLINGRAPQHVAAGVPVARALKTPKGYGE